MLQYNLSSSIAFLAPLPLPLPPWPLPRPPLPLPSPDVDCSDPWCTRTYPCINSSNAKHDVYLSLPPSSGDWPGFNSIDMICRSRTSSLRTFGRWTIDGFVLYWRASTLVLNEDLGSIHHHFWDQDSIEGWWSGVDILVSYSFQPYVWYFIP